MSQPTHFDQARVDQLFAATFAIPRDPRSDAYKTGVRASLQTWLLDQRTPCPYPAGSAESDAWNAGADEGYVVARKALNPEAA